MQVFNVVTLSQGKVVRVAGGYQGPGRCFRSRRASGVGHSRARLRKLSKAPGKGAWSR